MQANFIESNPLPVKAVLSMMGKIQEVYRLPLLPMRKDTRSKLQRIATEAGVVAKAAAPVAAKVDAPAGGRNEFYIYESWQAGPRKTIIHRGSCGQCNGGKGRSGGQEQNHARWHGPYANLSQAREAANTMAGVLIRSEDKCV